MADLRTRFTDDMKTAMKSGDTAATATIRLIISAMKMKDVDARGAGKEKAEEPELFSMMQTMIKQRQESSKVFRDNGRPELADKEDAEIKIIENYLPKQMSEADVDAAIAKVIAELGVTSVKDMGKVIGALKTKYAGQIDMAKASAMVKGKLAA
jgi:uncharacterized protein YqeY